jgi:4-hydroxy-tetrahydrodipicolinate synthase
MPTAHAPGCASLAYGAGDPAARWRATLSHVSFRGVFSALATPFDSDGRVDVAALRHAVEHQISEGIAGIVPCGSTGEFASLSHDERRLVVETVLAEADGRVPIIPQTGALTTAEAIALSQHAGSAGAAAVLCVPPFYAPMTKSELAAYYEELVAAVDVPVVFYNIPSCSKVILTATEILDLAAGVGIGFVKDSSGDVDTLTELIQDYGDRLTTFPGWDTLILYAFILGARTSILGAATFIPALSVRLLDQVDRGELNEATDLWSRIRPVLDFIGAEGYVAGVKAASQLLGVPMGVPRRPFAPFSRDATARLATLLEDAGLPVGRPATA